MPDRELVASGEIWSQEGFQECTIVFKQGDVHYAAKSSHRQFDLDNLDTATPIALDAFWGTWRPHLTEAPISIPAHAHLKEIDLLGYCVTQPEERHSLGDRMVDEAEVYELLNQKSHPNICTYYGCVRRGDRVTALCLQRHVCDLSQAIRNKMELTSDKVMADIRAGLDYLHSLGYAHNDLNPRNILISKTGNAVLIDFETCCKEGKVLKGFRGMPGYWSGREVSSRESDFYALSLIEHFVTEPGWQPDIDFGPIESQSDVVLDSGITCDPLPSLYH